MSDLCITIAEKTFFGTCNYKIIVKENYQSFTAMENLEQFKNFLFIYNADKKEKIFFDKFYSTYYGQDIESYTLQNCYFEEILFWDIEEIPINAGHFIGLSNGSLTNCYFWDNEDGFRIVARPNPNAKNVYHIYDYQQTKEFTIIKYYNDSNSVKEQKK